MHTNSLLITRRLTAPPRWLTQPIFALLLLLGSLSPLTAQFGNEINGGTITLMDGVSTEMTICADDVPDPITVLRDGNATGDQRAFVITDLATGQILGLPPNNGPFVLDGAGAGVCQIWYVAYADDLVGLEMGANVADLQGCFSASNPITVTRNVADGGTISLADGGTEITICADDIPDPIAVTRAGDAVGENRRFIVTDQATGEILGMPGNNGPFVLDGAGAGTCEIWYLAWSGELAGAMVGNNVSDLEGCFDLSNPITVVRNFNEGGGIALPNGGTEMTICADDVPSPITVVRDGSAQGDLRTFIITDQATGEILGVPGNDGPFVIDGAGAGVCEIWYLAYTEGIEGLAAGNNVSDLAGCFDLSNPITVTRNVADGGAISLPDGGTEMTICADDVPDPITVVRDGSAEGDLRTFIITDMATGQILGVPGNDGPFVIDGAGAGTCQIWYLAYAEGLQGLAMGNNVSDLEGCFDLSNPITVVRNFNEGGGIALPNGGTEMTICADDVPSPITVVRDGSAQGDLRTFIITDQATGEILGVPGNDGPFVIDGAGAGVCEIWYLAYTEGIEGLAAGNNVSDLAGCFDLSNPITVTRNVADGGGLTLPGGGTERTICADQVPDPISVVRDGTAEGDFRTFIITDLATGEILGVPAGDGPFTLDGAGGGTCQIWYLAYAAGLEGLAAGNNIDDLEGCFDLSNPVTVIRNAAEGGAIALPNGVTETVICVDNNPDPLTIIRNGGAEGEVLQYVITDLETGEILGLPGEGFNFDLNGAGIGDCQIWLLAYSGDITGLEMGANVDDLSGCFDFSNPITVRRQAADGGEVFTTNGATEVTVTGFNNTIVALFHETEADRLNYAYVVTDSRDRILAAFNRTTAALNFAFVRPGEYRIYGYSWLGQSRLFRGRQIQTLVAGNRCASLSSNFIRVTRRLTGNSLTGKANGSTTTTWPEMKGDLLQGQPLVSNEADGFEPATLATYPNPAMAEVTLELNGLGVRKADLQIYNSAGKVVRDRRASLVDGPNVININDLAPGAYVIKITGGPEAITQRLIVR